MAKRLAFTYVEMTTFVKIAKYPVILHWVETRSRQTAYTATFLMVFPGRGDRNLAG